MSQIIFREVETKDLVDIKYLINTSFQIYKYIRDDDILDTFLNIYVESCLAEKTFSQVAEKDGKIIGVIFGNSKRNYSILAHLKPIIKGFYYGVKMKIQARVLKVNMEEQNKIHAVYKELLKKSGKKFDGVLTLFIVDEKFRGSGIGTNLLDSLYEYFEMRNVNDFYLYTDSYCNVGFYESNGFVKLASKDIDIIKEDRQAKMEIYLYEFNMF